MKNTIKYRALGLLLIAVMVFSAMPVQQAQAATLDVCPSGCTYASIQAAIDDAVDGDTINVSPGTYPEAILLNKPNITVISTDGAENTIISTPAGTLTTGVLVSANMGVVTFDGFHVQNFTENGIIQGRDSAAGTVFHVKNNIITPANGYLRNGIQVTGDGSTVTGNTVHGAPLTVGWASSGIMVVDVSNVLVSENTILGGILGVDIGISLYAPSAPSVANFTIQNNIVHNAKNAVRFSGGSSANVMSSILVTGNVMTENIRAINVQKIDLRDVEIKNNDISNNTECGLRISDTSATATGVIVKDNSFANNFPYQILHAGAPIDASPNWWGSASGPASGSIYGEVVYSPWYADEAMTVKGYDLPEDADTDEKVEAFINNTDTVPLNSVVRMQGPIPGGIDVTRGDITFILDGATIGAGSPGFIVDGDNVTIQGGKFDGAAGSGLGSGFPGVLVLAGADNFILDGVEITGWTDGVQVAGAVESLKIVNNWIHSNSASALKVDATPTGVVTIEGNLFKVNDGVDVVYGGSGALDVTYNSWGAVTGPIDALGTNVAYEPWTFSEIYMDMDPGTAGDQYTRHVTSTEAFDVVIKAEAANLYGLSFKFKYDTAKLSAPTITFDHVWDGSEDGQCTVLPDLQSDEIGYYCALQYPATEWDGGTIATFTFTATNSGEAYFDVYSDETLLSTAAVGGVKVWVNNAGYNAPSSPDRDVSDLNDGKLDIDISQFAGFIDLQGRTDDSGAAFTVYDNSSGTTQLASATSAASGKYTTEYLAGQFMNFMGAFWIKVDRALFLPTFFMQMDLNGTPLTTVDQLLLLGGDANDNDVIDIGDATCIGGAYGSTTPAACSGAGWNDVNGDGVVNIYDLVLMGGNFSKEYSIWSP